MAERDANKRDALIKRDLPNKKKNASKPSVKRDIPKKSKNKPSVNRDINNMRNTRSGNVGPKMNIKEQTLAKRRSVKQEKRINPDSPEVKRNARRAQEYKIKKKNKGARRVAMAYTVLFLFVFICVSLVVGLLFYANLVTVEKSQYSDISLIMGLRHELEELDDISVDVSKYYRDGMLYLNMTALADEFGFIVTGDHKELRFIANEKNGEQVRFQLNTCFAEINGSSVKLDGKVIKEDEKIYVPASFVEEYMSGIEYSFDEKECLISVLRITDRNEAGRFVSSDIGFKLKNDTASVSLPEDQLSEAEQAKCYFKNITEGVFNTSTQG